MVTGTTHFLIRMHPQVVTNLDKFAPNSPNTSSFQRNQQQFAFHGLKQPGKKCECNVICPIKKTLKIELIFIFDNKKQTC